MPARRFTEIDPADAVDIVLPRDDIIGPVNEMGEPCPWPWDPIQLQGAPLGQYHCGYCGAMVIAGMDHVDYAGLDDMPVCSACGNGPLTGADETRGQCPGCYGRVVHLRREAFDVRIDRRTPYGNPFVLGRHGTRPEVIERFRTWARTSADPGAVWIREHVHELRSKTLGCHCHPEDCHGWVLLEMAHEVR